MKSFMDVDGVIDVILDLYNLLSIIPIVFFVLLVLLILCMRAYTYVCLLYTTLVPIPNEKIIP